MIVVKTLEEAKAATSGAVTSYFPFAKNEFLQEVHAGYDDLLDRGKQLSNKSLVGFWYKGALENYLYPDIFFFDKETRLQWDRDECIAWAEQKNIDIVWAPDYEDEISLLNISNIEYYKGLMDRIFKTNDYAKFLKEHINQGPELLKLKMNCMLRLINNNGWKYCSTYQYGIGKYIMAHFTNTHTNSRVAIFEPKKSPEGIYYSPLYSKYTAKEKEILARIEPTILDFSGWQDIALLKDEIDVYGKEIDLTIEYLNTYTDEVILGPKKKIVEVKIAVRKEPDTIRDYISVVIDQ